VIDLPLSLLLALVAPTPTSTTPAPADERDGATSIDALVIDATVAELVALEAAVRLRIGECPVTRSDRARKPRPGELFAYLEVEPGAGDRATLRLTLGDARAWVRMIDAPPADRTREIATTVGNLMAGIEIDAIAPDLRDVPLPVPLRPAVVPVAAPEVVPAKARPRASWALGVDATAVLELGPPAPTGFGAGGVALRGGARLPGGALLEAGIRGAWYARGPYTLTRLRLELAAGYALHRGRFALHTTAGATAEPWFVTSSGGLSPGDRRPTSALLGGVVRLSPQWQLGRGERRVHVGPFVEVAGSAVPGANGGVARLRQGTGADAIDVYRAGGLELAAGVAFGLWSPARRR